MATEHEESLMLDMKKVEQFRKEGKVSETIYKLKSEYESNIKELEREKLLRALLKHGFKVYR